MLSQDHLNVCLQHDWGIAAILENGVIKNLKEILVSFDTQETTENTVEFSNFIKLTIWAGY